MNPPSNKASKTISRRDFLKSFARVKNKAPQKEPAAPVNPEVPQRFALAALKDLPDPILRPMVPVLRQGVTVTILNTAVEFRAQDGEGGLVPLSREACVAVRLFDGTQTLEQVGSILDIEQPGPPGHGFRLAREAFLMLSARAIYHPAGPLGCTGTEPEARGAAIRLTASEPGNDKCLR